jgi:hypothetical protein
MSEKYVRSRRLILLFAATTVLPAASLALVGWRLIEAGRHEQLVRAEANREDAREHAANLFLRRKESLDPDSRFQSDWWRHYSRMFAAR